MSRWKASAIHASISILLLLSIGTVMALTWYPPLLAWAAGKTGLGGILFGVDACLGPLLTLVVFKSGKPGLKFDLSMIALVQVLALSYGLYVLYQARPVYIVFSEYHFELVSAVDIPLEIQAKAAQPRFKSFPLAGPEFIGVRMPEDDSERMGVFISVNTGGPDLHQFPKYYLPYEDVAREVVGKASPVGKLMGRDEPTREKLARWLDKNNRDALSVKYLPIKAKVHGLTALIDSGTGAVLDTLGVQP